MARTCNSNKKQYTNINFLPLHKETEIAGTKFNKVNFTSIPILRYVLRVTLKLRSKKFHVVSLISLSIGKVFLILSQFTYDGIPGFAIFHQISFVFAESIRRSCHFHRQYAGVDKSSSLSTRLSHLSE